MPFENDQKRQPTYGLGGGATITADVGMLLRLNGAPTRGFQVQAGANDIFVMGNIRLVGGEAKDPGGNLVLDTAADGGAIAVNNGSSGAQFFLESPEASLTTGTGRAGSTHYTMVLAADASSTRDAYVGPYGSNLVITGGTGSGQSAKILSYNGTTKVVQVDTPWTTIPDATSTYDVQALFNLRTILGIKAGLTVEIKDATKGNIWREYTLVSIEDATTFTVQDVDGAVYASAAAHEVRFRHQSNYQEDRHLFPKTFQNVQDQSIKIAAGELLTIGAATGDDNAAAMHTIAVVAGDAVGTTITGGTVVPT